MIAAYTFAGNDDWTRSSECTSASNDEDLIHVHCK